MSESIFADFLPREETTKQTLLDKLRIRAQQQAKKAEKQRQEPIKLRKPKSETALYILLQRIQNRLKPQKAEVPIVPEEHTEQPPIVQDIDTDIPAWLTGRSSRPITPEQIKVTAPALPTEKVVSTTPKKAVSRKDVLRVIGGSAAAVMIGAVIPPIFSRESKAATTTLSKFILKLGSEVGSGLDQATKKALATEGMQYFRQLSSRLYSEIKRSNPDLVTFKSPPEETITNIQPSDEMPFPNPPPDTVGAYLQEGKEGQENQNRIIDGVVQLYYQGGIVYPEDNTNQNSALLAAEVHKKAEETTKALLTALRNASLNQSTPITSLNRLLHSGSLVTNLDLAEEMIRFATQDKNKDLLNCDFLPPHDTATDQSGNVYDRDPQKAMAVLRNQYRALELSSIASQGKTITDVQKNRVQMADDGKIADCNKDAFSSWSYGLVSFSRNYPSLLPFDQIETLVANAIDLHIDGKININLLASLDDDQMAEILRKLRDPQYQQLQPDQFPINILAGSMIATSPFTRQLRERRQEDIDTQTNNNRTTTISRRNLFKMAVLGGATAALSAANFGLGDVIENPSSQLGVLRLIKPEAWKIFVAEIGKVMQDSLLNRGSGSMNIFYSDGKTPIAEQFQKVRRSLCDLKDVPSAFTNALIGIEDNRFYEHDGADPVGLGRAVDSQSRGGTEGGSGITLQMLKLILGHVRLEDRTVENKIAELLISIIYEQALREKYRSATDPKAEAKKKVLETYINLVPFGQQIAGVKKAAEVYFGRKKLSDLTEGEAIFLAGIPNNPDSFNPHSTQLNTLIDQTTNRLILLDSHPGMIRYKNNIGQLVAEGRIIQEHATQLLSETLSFQLPEKNYVKDQSAIDYVFPILDNLPPTVRNQELTVTTSIDVRLQQSVKNILQEKKDFLDKFGAQVATIVVRDENGAIVALVGPIQDRRIGSIAKFPTLVTAMEEGTLIKESNVGNEKSLTVPLPGGKTWTLKNFLETYGDSVSLAKAFNWSLNIPFVQEIMKLGTMKVFNQWHKLGLIQKPEGINIDAEVNYQMTLGTNLRTNIVRVTDMVSAIFNDGMRVRSTPITEIRDSTGKIVYTGDGQRTKQQVAPSKVCNDIVTMMSDNTNKLPELVDKPQYVLKTGSTSNDSSDPTKGAFDCWAAGAMKLNHHTYTVAVWAGNKKDEPMSAKATGESVAVPIYEQVIDTLMQQMVN